MKVSELSWENTRQGQVKDQCLSLIYYLWCCVLGLRVTLRVIEHPLVLSTCEIGSTPKTLQVKWFPWFNMQKEVFVCAVFCKFVCKGLWQWSAVMKVLFTEQCDTAGWPSRCALSFMITVMTLKLVLRALTPYSAWVLGLVVASGLLCCCCSAKVTFFSKRFFFTMVIEVNKIHWKESDRLQKALQKRWESTWEASICW